MKKIPLHWFRDKSIKSNFGDELTHLFIEKITNKKVQYFPVPAVHSRIIYRGIKGLLRGEIELRNIPNLIKSLFYKKYLIGIGSLLGWCTSKNSIVWGSGIHKPNDIVYRCDFRLVRGKETLKRLNELGLNIDCPIGDPALISPIVFPKTKKIKYKYGIIPHYSNFEYCSKYKSDDFLLINILDPVDKILNQLNSCEKIISTSLHGIIVAQSYNIEALWFEIPLKPIGKSPIKFYDYFSSVGINNYSPFKLDFNDIEKWNIIFEKNSNLSLIQSDLFKIQKTILETFPFELNKKFSNLISE